MNKGRQYKMTVRRGIIILIGFVVSAMLVQPARAQNTVQAKKLGAAAIRSPYNSHNRLPHRANLYYSQVWGVDSFSVKTVESGEIIRFAWRVLDADKAKALNDKSIAPSLIDPSAGVSLVVPMMEKIGQLRQTSIPETGKSYWMAFSNKGRFVKRGDIVSVVIGSFKADGLVVQ